jgi:signal transduction histidine kinase
MSKPARQTKHSLSLRLSLSILAFTAIIFMITIGIIFFRSRHFVRQAATEQATQTLNNTAQGIMGLMDQVEVATDNSSWLVVRKLQPDSIMKFSRWILELNPDVYGCSISFEPNFFADQGKYFSVYSTNEDGHIETEQEGSEDYDYFGMIWYQEPIRQGKACWVDPFRDYTPGTSYDMMIASYGKPLFDTDGRTIGVISTDLSQRKLSQILSQERLYPNAYFIMTSETGHIIATSNEQARPEDLNRSDCLVVSLMLPNTNWKLSYICPDKDIFKGYNQLVYIVVSLILFGLLLMLAFSYFVVNRSVSPIQDLANQAQEMAEGQFDGHLDYTKRIDEIGQLQNSFVSMQEAITNYVNNLERVKHETEQRNQELIVAKSKAEEADRKKTAFIQDLSHQIRTPLNIIGGFTQVLRDEHETMDETEMENITHDIMQNSHTITNIIDNWMRTLALEGIDKVECHDDISCHEICKMAAETITLRNPDTVTLKVESHVPDSLHIITDQDCLLKVLSELLHNANKYTQKGSITLSCVQPDSQSVSFIVSDTGPGIAEELHEHVFTQFTKLDDFSEGLGMGLTLCKKLAGLLGGHITLDAAYTKGARFVLTLPISPERT